MKHKHAEVIKAFVDGKECEVQGEGTGWFRVTTLSVFDSWGKARVKPEPKPDVVLFIGVTLDCVSKGILCKYDGDNLKVVFDGETRKLKSAEVIK